MSADKDRLTKVMELILPSKMAADFDEEFGENTDHIAEQLYRYLSADAASKKDMEAFHNCNGISKMATSIYKLEQGITEDIDLT